MAEDPGGPSGAGRPGEPVEDWLGRLVDALAACLGPNLEGVYLHGSLAMGCFAAASSDVDLVLAVAAPLAEGDRAALRDLLLSRSGRPYPVELSVMTREERFPWRHPAPFSWHYSEAWRSAMAAEAAGGPTAPLPARDPDLAAHITMLHARGRPLRGMPLAAAFPEVPRRDFLDAVFTRDAGACLDSLRKAPVDGVLNLCRLGLYARTGRLGSKREGGVWALRQGDLPEPASVRRALGRYEAGEAGEEGSWSDEELSRFASAWTRRVGGWLDEQG